MNASGYRSLRGLFWNDDHRRLRAPWRLLAATVVLLGLAAGSASIGGTLQTRPDAQLALSGVAVLPATLLWLLFFLGVGTLEEVILRGYLLVNVAEGLDAVLTRRRAVAGGILASSVLFGVLHAANPGGTLLGVLNVGLAGILLGGAYATTGRLGIPAGVHVAWNFALGPVYGLPVSGLRTSSALVAVEQRGAVVLTGGEFGPEGGLAMLGALGVGVALTAWWIGRQEGGVSLRTDVAVPEVRDREPADETPGAE
jgi:membrane protease YdiL (CAAX protease family)